MRASANNCTKWKISSQDLRVLIYASSMISGVAVGS